MIWIKGRREELAIKTWSYFNTDKFLDRPIWNPRVKSLLGNGIPLSVNVLNYWAKCRDLEFMKWLHEKKCLLNENTFCNAALHGDLDNMRWLYENGCPFDEIAFYAA